MVREHHYKLDLRWTGNRGEGTSGYRNYDRSHEIHIEGKPVIVGSSDPAFMGDPSLHNPEDLLVASLSACHMLWYLHLCSDAGILVTAYEDEACGTMVETQGGAAEFTSVVLRPHITIKAGGNVALAKHLHERANELCFIASSVNFPVTHEPEIVEKG